MPSSCPRPARTPGLRSPPAGASGSDLLAVDGRPDGGREAPVVVGTGHPETSRPVGSPTNRPPFHRQDELPSASGTRHANPAGNPGPGCLLVKCPSAGGKKATNASLVPARPRGRAGVPEAGRGAPPHAHALPGNPGAERGRGRHNFGGRRGRWGPRGTPNSRATPAIRDSARAPKPAAAPPGLLSPPAGCPGTEEKRWPRHPKLHPGAARPPGAPLSASREPPPPPLAAGSPGAAPSPRRLALHPTPRSPSPPPPPLSPLTASRHFPRSSALNRKLAALPAAATAAADYAAAAAGAVRGLRRQPPEARRGDRWDL
ncbi:collagen alpha-1(I) chain-like [Dipodomys spectabilis]|uniref:collagen alpha-1(I) chain-like n=1 Tax=Dipodomys spectabilis TaxID=105255 RepID=UPI001C53906C|nr:collagen alpha-1(I) chain-like [Dipodomys spectabilis]